jgi:hypothetical protein
MEGLGLLLGEELGFMIVTDCEEVVYSWDGTCNFFVSGKLPMTFVVHLIIDICAMPGWEKLRSTPR